MALILDLLNSASYLPAFKVDEEDITTNIRLFKKYSWYNEYCKKKNIRKFLLTI